MVFLPSQLESAFAFAETGLSLDIFCCALVLDDHTDVREAAGDGGIVLVLDDFTDAREAAGDGGIVFVLDDFTDAREAAGEGGTACC